MKNNSKQIKQMTQLSLLGALIFVMAFIPFLGFIPLGFMNATIIHVPVIVGAIILGPKKGAMLGFLFGLASLIHSTIIPQPGSFIFTPFYPGGNAFSLIVCFVPRILIGVVSYYTYHGLKRFTPKNKIKTNFALFGAGVAGSLTNTLLVMNLTFIFFKEGYAAANNVAIDTLYSFILGIIGINGIPEAIIAGILTTFIIKAVSKIQKTEF